MRHLTLLGTGAVVLALSGCGNQKTDEFAAATPTASALTLEVQGGATEGVSTHAAAAVEPVVAAPSTTVDATNDLQNTRAALKTLNGVVTTVVGQVEAISQTDGQLLSADVKQYGPADRCVQQDATGACTATANLELRVRRHMPGMFSWVLRARPVGSTAETDFQPVLAGWLARGRMEHRGRGKLAIDLDALKVAAPTFTGSGALLAGFWSGPVAKAATYRLVGFTADGQQTPTTAAFAGYKTAAGTARVRAVALADVVKTTSAPELVLAHVGWNPDVGGRAFVVVSDWQQDGTLVGDVVPTTSYLFIRSCYQAVSADLLYRETFSCPNTSGPVACVTAPGATGTQVFPDPATTPTTWQAACGFGDLAPELASPTGVPAPAGTELEPGMGAMPAPEDPPMSSSSTDLQPPAQMPPASMM